MAPAGNGSTSFTAVGKSTAEPIGVVRADDDVAHRNASDETDATNQRALTERQFTRLSNGRRRAKLRTL